ncbi:type II toxin-antitoxin system prevent-host-death family antitoxin [Azospirillum sp. sgz302134]
MPVVGASEFVRGFGRFQDEAYREVVKVTSHGRVIGGYLSAPDLEHYERLKRRERELLIVGELPDDVVADIETAKHGAGPT